MRNQGPRVMEGRVEGRGRAGERKRKAWTWTRGIGSSGGKTSTRGTRRENARPGSYGANGPKSSRGPVKGAPAQPNISELTLGKRGKHESQFQTGPYEMAMVRSKRWKNIISLEKPDGSKRKRKMGAADHPEYQGM
uniref:Uncharacterized protein n=1 Tax=Trypanosoma congolense (strain IL3000) TaxID=1068625 RepID=G0UM43_TRYCI|nr:hypothetical protein, unlikely [Trypanosoma congolense IL3000]